MRAVTIISTRTGFILTCAVALPCLPSLSPHKPLLHHSSTANKSSCIRATCSVVLRSVIRSIVNVIKQKQYKSTGNIICGRVGEYGNRECGKTGRRRGYVRAGTCYGCRYTYTSCCTRVWRLRWGLVMAFGIEEMQIEYTAHCIVREM